MSMLSESFTFGDDLDWEGPSAEVTLYVELPFWLMVKPCSVNVEYEDVSFPIDVYDSQFEVFAAEITDSKRTCIYRGPRTEQGWEPSADILALVERDKVGLMERSCRTVLRLHSSGLITALQADVGDASPRLREARAAYRASLCEAHIPVINELIQRYRLVTYDYFPYEVSAWDVPIWYVRQADHQARAILMPYRQWDSKPVAIDRGQGRDGEVEARPFEFTNGSALAQIASDDATPGEFDLLDARSLMERGDYTGAVRRTTTAIEAVTEWALRSELLKSHSKTQVKKILKETDMNFKERLAQLRTLLGKDRAPVVLEAEFDKTRKLRHDIVHRARRITHAERGIAQRCVDTGRWLFNKIENRPDRANVREDRRTLRSVGRVALAPRFPTRLTSEGIKVDPMLAGMPKAKEGGGADSRIPIK